MCSICTTGWGTTRIHTSILFIFQRARRSRDGRYHLPAGQQQGQPGQVHRGGHRRGTDRNVRRIRKKPKNFSLDVATLEHTNVVIMKPSTFVALAVFTVLMGWQVSLTSATATATLYTCRHPVTRRAATYYNCVPQSTRWWSDFWSTLSTLYNIIVPYLLSFTVGIGVRYVVDAWSHGSHNRQTHWLLAMFVASSGALTSFVLAVLYT